MSRESIESPSSCSAAEPASAGGGATCGAGEELPGAAHVAVCFDVLLAHFKRGHAVPVDESLHAWDQEFPMFVTWKKWGEDRRGRKLHLRGCIGTFTAQPLAAGLKEYALTSSLKDRRFDPLEPEEIPHLVCSVSLLLHFETARDWADWEVGTHGITIEFRSARGKRYSATYLPEVASEQGWDHATCVDSLIRKSGFRDAITHALRDSLKVTRYQSCKRSMSYAEYTEYCLLAARA